MTDEFNEKCKIAHNDTLGRYVRACENIKAGEPILNESPILIIACPGDKRCSNCFRLTQSYCSAMIDTNNLFEEYGLIEATVSKERIYAYSQSGTIHAKQMRTNIRLFSKRHNTCKILDNCIRLFSKRHNTCKILDNCIRLFSKRHNTCKTIENEYKLILKAAQYMQVFWKISELNLFNFTS
uniref:Uncharacterized protein n=1 Tax=Glossina palpalis gambiensis TaxID=67801 RepID=A0A1B0BJ62_9MUSC